MIYNDQNAVLLAAATLAAAQYIQASSNQPEPFRRMGMTASPTQYLVNTLREMAKSGLIPEAFAPEVEKAEPE